jgi:hypothetical protein
MNLNKSVRGALRASLVFLLSALLRLHLSVAQVPRRPDVALGGTVTTVTADQATIKTLANEPFTVVFAANTTFWKQVGTSFRTVPAKVTDIHVGNSINVTGHLDPDGVTKHAKIVMILNAETSQKLLAHGGEGESQVSGKVTEIQGTRLTVARYDNLTQVIEVNPQTVFFKGSSPATITAQLFASSGTVLQTGLETLTLADVKPGDIVYTAGALKFPATVPLKDNIYVASKVAVVSIPKQVVPEAAPKQ